MFETSSVQRNRQKFHPLTFAISAVLHIGAIAAVTFITIWDVEVPTRAPDQVVGFQTAAAPPPPMISRGTPEGKREPVTETPPKEQLRDTAPVVIPSIIAAPIDTAVGPAAGDEESDEPFGDPGGSIGGDPDGDILGTDLGSGTGSGTLERTYDLGDGVHPPTILHRPEPVYPALLQRIGKSGVVQLQCVISRDGTLNDIRVIHASHPLFAESAIAAVKQWKFLPGRLDGRAVATRFDFTVTFNVQR